MAGTVLVVGGTAGIGRELAARYAARGRPVVITGREASRAEAVAAELGAAAPGADVSGLALDLAEPQSIATGLAGVGPVDQLILAAIDRDANSAKAYDIAAAIHLATLKLVGYTEVVHALGSRLTGAGSVLLFGGMARVRPYPGSTTVSAINAGVIGMVRTLSVELAPIRVNSIHPGIVGDSPFWTGKSLDAVVTNTLTGRLATMAEVVDASVCLLENGALNGVDLVVDGGWR
jgi:NAD(P)-dependent dehydrogenase (short-subunit alcohol dehydrogenase family)